MENTNNCGIYCWVNKVNGKKYIGQSAELNERKKSFSKFGRKNYSGKLINKARLKYNSLEYWDYKVLEYCEEFQLDEKEKYFISYYDSNKTEKGYNLNEGGDGNRGYHHTEELKRKLSEMNKGKPLSEETKLKFQIH